MSSSEEAVKRLGLQPHPEGGFFKECYRSDDLSPSPPPRFGAGRGPVPYCTSIFYLLAGSDFSAFHRIKSDELWYFHEGSGMIVHELEAGGAYRAHELGRGAAFFCAIKAGSWFGAEPCISGAAPAEPAWALVSCAVSPGFDYGDFELAARAALTRSYPDHRALIERLTRG
jgi:uncharacterized protein